MGSPNFRRTCRCSSSNKAVVFSRRDPKPRFARALQLGLQGQFRSGANMLQHFAGSYWASRRRWPFLGLTTAGTPTAIEFDGTARAIVAEHRVSADDHATEVIDDQIASDPHFTWQVDPGQALDQFVHQAAG